MAALEFGPTARRAHLSAQVLFARGVARLGWLGLAGRLLFAASVIAAPVLWGMDRAEHRRLADELRRITQSNGAATGPALDTSHAADFPTPVMVPAILETIDEKAQDAGILLSSAEYRWAPASDARLAEYECLFALKSEYVPLREFVRDVLEAEPALAVREMTLVRAQTSDRVLDVHLRLVIFLKSAGQ